MFVTYGLFGAVRQHRGRDQRRDDLRRPVAAQRDADAARHRRHRAHRRHRGRLQRADLRAHPRGGARRAHRRSPRSTPGFTRALATILDSNITTFIAAAVLFFIGTGPVRGFAVTLGIGIITTVFTAFTLTRLIVALWVRWWRPQDRADLNDRTSGHRASSCACFASFRTTPSSISCASGASAFRSRRCCRSLAIVLYFIHGLNFGIDFVGGTLIEVQAKAGPADLAEMRATLDGLGLGDVQLQQFGAPDRRADPHRRSSRAARRRSRRRWRRCAAALGDAVDYRRVEVVGPARLERTAGLRHARPGARDRRHPDLSLVPLRMAVRARRHDRQRARSRADDRLHVADADRLRPDQHRGAAHHPRLFAQRHRRHLRPHPRDAAPLQADADARPAQHLDQCRRCRARSSPTSR